MKKLHTIGASSATIFLEILKKTVSNMVIRNSAFDYPSFLEAGLKSLPEEIRLLPREVARAFAKEKAALHIGETPEHVVSFHSIGIMVTGDTEEEIRNPANWPETEAMLRRLSEQSFEYFVGIACGVPQEGGTHEYAVETCSVMLSVRAITDAEIGILREKTDGISNAHAFGRFGFGYRPLTWAGICEFICELDEMKVELASELERASNVLFRRTELSARKEGIKIL